MPTGSVVPRHLPASQLPVALPGSASRAAPPVTHVAVLTASTDASMPALNPMRPLRPLMHTPSGFAAPSSGSMHATTPASFSVSLSRRLPLSLCQLLTHSLQCMLLLHHNSQLLYPGARLARDACLSILLPATHVKLLHLRCRLVPDLQCTSAVGAPVQTLQVAKTSTAMIRIHKHSMHPQLI